MGTMIARAASLVVTLIVFAGCSKNHTTPLPTVTSVNAKEREATGKVPGPDSAAQPNLQQENSYLPTAEEMEPMRQEYLAELGKVHEPPEMANLPLQVRKAVNLKMLKAWDVISSARLPGRTHEQRAIAIAELTDVANTASSDDYADSENLYRAIAQIACMDGAGPDAVIGYASNALRYGNDARALRARMYLKKGERAKALDDLVPIMVDREALALSGTDSEPRQESTPCGWSIADIDALGEDPRAPAAKGLYLSSFMGPRAIVTEAEIRGLYARSAVSWSSPIPHFLTTTFGEVGSENYLSGVRCRRKNIAGEGFPDLASACAKYDDGTRREIREMTMAIIIDPSFAPALSSRGILYLRLAQGAYADKKPSRKLFQLAIQDFTSALAAGGKDKYLLHCVRAIALASIGNYMSFG